MSRRRKPNQQKARARALINQAAARISGVRVKGIALGQCAFVRLYAPGSNYIVEVNIHYHEADEAESIMRRALAPWLMREARA